MRRAARAFNRTIKYCCVCSRGLFGGTPRANAAPLWDILGNIEGDSGSSDGNVELEMMVGMPSQSSDSFDSILSVIENAPPIATDFPVPLSLVRTLLGANGGQFVLVGLQTRTQLEFSSLRAATESDPLFRCAAASAARFCTACCGGPAGFDATNIAGL